MVMGKITIDSWIRILATAYQMEDASLSDISKKTDITYSHIFNVLNLFIDKGIVKTNKIGRRRLIEFTEEGKELAKECVKFVNISNKCIFDKSEEK